MSDTIDKVKLSEYLDTCAEFEAGNLTQEEADARFTDFYKRLVVRDYMSIKNKMISITKILFATEEIIDAVASAAYLEMRKVLVGLLSYAVNLENDVEALGPLFPVYDKIHEYGLYDQLLGYCADDYFRFCDMLSDAISVSNIRALSESAALFDNAAFTEWVDKMVELKDQLTPEFIQGLIALNTKNDTSVGSLIDTLSAAAVDGSAREFANVIDEIRNTNENEETLKLFKQILGEDNKEDEVQMSIDDLVGVTSDHNEEGESKKVNDEVDE